MSEMERESTGGAVLVDPYGGLLLDPSNELKFRGPFDDYVTVSLMIKNPTDKRIAFKIKTTAPKRYCVKPNSGVLDSQQSMKVNVLLQPFNYDPNEKNKHKFMVQYMYLNDTEMVLGVNEILNMWKDVPATRLLDIKLRCIFEQTESEQQQGQQQQQSQPQPQPQQQSSSQKPQNEVKQTTETTKAQAISTSAQSPTAGVKQQQQDSRQTPNRTETSADFESAPSSLVVKSHNVNNSNNARLDKSDNVVNELIQVKQENELLKKEINKLKEEEARLRKLALQSPVSGSRPGQHNNGSLDILIDLLQNRSSVVIAALLAIIIYLILFR